MYDFRDKARYWSKIEMFSYPLHSTPPLGGPRLNIAIPFGTDKLEQRGYPMVQKYDDININNLPHRAIFHSTGWSVHISVKTYDDWCTTRFRSGASIIIEAPERNLVVHYIKNVSPTGRLIASHGVECHQ